ncbi:MAG: hypothetical protein CMI16_13380 [Opitutaceae bacterium]|nr:hypothetical protein [Opitutaceae bacterium]
MLFLIRKLEKLLRGNITPFRIIAGCVLGAMLGFMPGFSNAPGLIFALSFGLLVINGNLLLAGFVGIAANNLSTQPGLASASPKISITSASDKVAFEADFGGISAGGGDNALSFHYRGLPVDQIMGSLKSTKTTLKGGTVDVAASGRYFTSSGAIDLPLEATLHDTPLSLAGRDTKVSSFTLPIGLTGQLDNPRIKVDAKSLGNLAIKAGTDALKGKATEQLKDKAGGLFNKLLGN